MRKMLAMLLALMLALMLATPALAEAVEATTEAATEAAETVEAAEAEAPAVSPIIEKLVGLPWYTWVLLVLLLGTGFILAMGAKQNTWNSHRVAMGAMCIAIAFVLSCIRLFRMPQGGSITPASMLPLVLFMVACGPLQGFVVGCAYGLLQLITDPYIIHPIQLLLDYPLASGAMILGCLATLLPIERRWQLPVAVLLVWLLLTNYVFLIRNVQVVGAGDMSEADVVRLSGIPLGGRLNAVDKAALRAKLESTGQLAFVSAEKKYPDTVVLTVRQRSRDAITLQAGKLLVLDSDGYVVSVGDVAPEDGMPYVMGLKFSTYRLGKQIDAPESRLNAMKAVLEALKAHNAMGYVSEINLEHLSDIELIARKGIVVSLGDADNMNNKIIWMVGALQDLESRGETLGRLDVSSGSKADFLSGATPTPAPTPTPVPEITPEAVIGEDAI